jgi:hypothetical protein
MRTGNHMTDYMWSADLMFTLQITFKIKENKQGQLTLVDAIKNVGLHSVGHGICLFFRYLSE